MRSTREIGVAVVAASALLVGGCGGEPASTTADPGAAASGVAPADAPAASPSRFAKREIPPAELRMHVRAGREMGLDWAVIAAADRLAEGRGAGTSPEDRIASIGYALQGSGAPEDYRVALAAYGGSEGFARRALALADDYRDVGVRPPPTDGPLELPVDGQVLAAFGQQYGLLHDGIDVAAGEGEPIHAAADGVTVSTGFSGVYGEYSCVLHRFRRPVAGERELVTCYGNQSAYETAPGDRVRAGQIIGRVGCSGPCLRPHLHFQVRLGRSALSPVADPAPFLAPGVRIEAGRPLEAG